MKQVVNIREDPVKPNEAVFRIVEGVAIYLEPDRIYGGLVVAETIAPMSTGTFETTTLPTKRSLPASA